MKNLFDMMMEAQNGNAVNSLSKQFGLTREQTEQALELMMPAFSNGLKRNTADPMQLMNFMGNLSSGRHEQYHNDAAAAFRDDAINDGNEILAQLFGSKDTSRAVADQVAFASGIGPTILKQMLPVVASMLMGGLFKNSVGSGRAANPMGDLLGGIMENMMRGGMDNFTGGSQSRQAENPFGKMMEDFLGGMGQTTRQTQRPPERGEDIFGEMFETGRRVQDEYQKNIDNIFDTFLDGMRKR